MNLFFIRTRFLFLLLFATGCLLAQKTEKVTGIKGLAYVAGDVSPNQAKKMALSDAKLNALKAAGIKEHLSSYQVLFTSQQKNDYAQFFNSDIQSELQGAVQAYDVKSEKTYCKNELEIVCEVTIDATIIKYDTRPDAAFDANIEGIKSAYTNDDKLSFSIKATQGCYLTIFNITDTEALLLYPNEYEKQVKCTPLQACTYPTAKIDYILHTDMAKQETNRLIFVFTKTPVPFIKMNKDQVTTPETIFTWIYSITPDQRKVDCLTTSIQK